MCQYSNRCPVGQHRPGTKCQYSGSSRPDRNYPMPSPYRMATPSPGSSGRVSGATAQKRRYRTAVASTGINGLDVLAIFILAAVWDGNPDAISTGTILFAVLLVLLPLGLGIWLTRTCTAWNGTAEGRCVRVCYGLRRCGIPEHSRSAQFLALPEGVALLSWGVAVLNIWILLSAAL